MSFSLNDIDAFILGDEEVEVLIGMFDGADLVLVVDEVSRYVNRMY